MSGRGDTSDLSAQFRTQIEAQIEGMAQHFSQDAGAQENNELGSRRAVDIAIGFSGGGDSAALLHLWLDLVPKLAPQIKIKNIHALIVDHGLRLGSGREAEQSAQTAKTLGAIPHILRWDGAKPKSAIQEKARLARYDLMGRKCRSLGIKTLWLGHSQNDQAETVMMRAERGSTWRGLAGMASYSHRGVWPALYGIALARPLLGISRGDLRVYNRQWNVPYLDDPSNANEKYRRVQIRKLLSEHPDLYGHLLTLAQNSRTLLKEERQYLRQWSHKFLHIFAWGGAFISTESLRSLARPLGQQILTMVLSAVSGQSDQARSPSVAKLLETLTRDGFKGASLGGAALMPHAHENVTGILICRDPGAVLGRSDMNIRPEPFLFLLNEKSQNDQGGGLWDGRYLCEGRRHTQIVACGQVWDKITPVDKKPWGGIPFMAQKTLPCWVGKSAKVHVWREDDFQSLTNTRLGAMLGY